MTFLIPLAAAAVGAFATSSAADKSAKAAQSAANTQAGADQAAIAEQRRQFDTTQSNLAPWLAAGKAALGGQLDLLGLGGGGTPGAPAAAAPTVGAYNIPKLLADNPDIASWVQQGHGDPNAAGPQTPEQAVNYWIQNGIANGEQRAIDAPRYTAADIPAAGPGGAMTPAAQAQQAAIDQLKNSPLYQSLYRNGQDAILANGSATGGLRGGNMQRSLANFGSDTLASVIQQQLQNLGGISNTGNSTGTNLGQLGAGAAANIGNLTVNQGGAQAGGILGSAALQNGGALSALQQLLSGAGQSYSAYGAWNSTALPGGYAQTVGDAYPTVTGASVPALPTSAQLLIPMRGPF